MKIILFIFFKAIIRLLEEVKRRDDLSKLHPERPAYLTPPYGRLPMPTPLISRAEFLDMKNKGSYKSNFILMFLLY